VSDLNKVPIHEHNDTLSRTLGIDSLLQELTNHVMTNLKDLTTNQLQRILDIKEQIAGLQSELDSIATDGGETPVPFFKAGRGRRKNRMSKAGRAAIAAAARARWAKYNGKAAVKPAGKKRRKMSAAAKAKMAEAARARWAAAKAAGKTRL
jgi:hypothetical protein